jgi:hypothetical protein
MQIYHVGYWLRLLDALHDEYPLVTALFGTDNFDNEIGVPYLLKYPSTYWSLHALGRFLPKWVEEEYQASDRKLILTAASIDWACQQSFFVKGAPPIDLSQYMGKNAEKILTVPIILQPHVHLFELDAHFLHFREAIMTQESDYWLEHDFPKLEKERTHYFIIFRNAHLNIEWDELHPTEYLLLKQLQTPMQIEEAIDHVQQVPNLDLDHLEEMIAFWMQKWLLRGWLCGN